MKIKQVMIKKFNRKTGDYTKVVDLFEKYSVLKIEDTKIGKAVDIQGPKKQFRLYEVRNGLTILIPPKEEGASALKVKVPLFFVSPMYGSGTIQGCEYFALINNELVAYRKTRYGVEPLDRNFDYHVCGAVPAA